ncbi:MAG: DUF4255 domain-containing protein [Acidobacteria bacterium]|nr:DUF4255 domain-containing protein [Acidobacteriota bacterium]
MPSAVNIVGDVTQMLNDLLLDLTPSLDSPADLRLQGNNDTARINIYLYQVLENPYAKNQHWRTRENGDLRFPPLALNLYYLLTPYANDQLSAHHVLGDAMRILHDHSLLVGPALIESLRLTVEQIAIVLVPLQLEDLTRIWNALQSPYRLSVAYEVRVVLVPSETAVTPDRVTVRINRYSQL